MNQRSTFMLMREGVRRMRESGNGGRIVNVTTMGTLHPVLHGNAAYSASRAGVVAMTRSIAFDFAKDRILANCVHPGAVRSKTRFHETLQARLAAGAGWRDPAPIPRACHLGWAMARTSRPQCCTSSAHPVATSPVSRSCSMAAS